MSIYGAVGEGDLSSFYWGQGFYRRKEDQSWILDYTITRNVNSLVTRVQDDYTSGGWTKHHAQILEYEETSAENSKSSITFEVAEPADDMEKNWKVTLITSYRFEKSVVNQLTEKDNIPVTSFGMEWMGSSDANRCCTVRKIKLLGMKGPDNYFTIFLPKEPLAAVCPPVPTATLDTLPDGPLEAKHLCGVLRYLERHNLVSRWRRIGLELELSDGDLEVMQRNRDSVEDRAAGMLNQWLTSGRATKQALVEAVQEVK